MSALEVLVALFDELAHDHPRTALPLLVRTVGPLEAPELGVLALEGEHPASVLLGFTAPEACSALGVVTTGWSLPPGRFAEHDLDRNRRAGPPAAACADRVAVRSTVLVARDGAIAGRLSVEGAEPVTSPPESGVMVDLLQRALGCPTAPPAFGTIELFASVWLAALAARDATNWPSVARRHWALQLLPGEPDDLPRLAEELAAELDWAAVRRAAARSGWAGGCSAAEAAWFDDGAFARWVLGSYPAIADLAAAATAGMPPGVARTVRSALAHWGLGDTDR